MVIDLGQNKWDLGSILVRVDASTKIEIWQTWWRVEQRRRGGVPRCRRPAGRGGGRAARARCRRSSRCSGHTHSAMSPSSPSRQLEFSNLDIKHILIFINKINTITTNCHSMTIFEDFRWRDYVRLFTYYFNKEKKLVDTLPNIVGISVHRCHIGEH